MKHIVPAALALSNSYVAQANPTPGVLVVWDSPSENAWGSMPIGNGDLGANVWVEPSGDFILLLSKTDAWDEVARLVKLGRIRIKLPSVENFRQELRMAEGEIRIQAGHTTTRVWIDANRPVVHVEIHGEKPFTTSVAHETWRTTARHLGYGEIRGSWGLHHVPEDERPMVSADTVLEGQRDRIGFYHRNTASVWAAHLRLQKMDAFLASSADPLLHRTFGCLVRGNGLVSDGKSRLTAQAPATRFEIAITALVERSPTADDWVRKVAGLADAAERVPLEQARTAHAKWWRDFWDRSWIVVGDRNALPVHDQPSQTGPDSNGGSRFRGEIAGAGVMDETQWVRQERAVPDAEIVTRGYMLQRWMNACAGRGGAPIKFNGSIFNVECVHPVKSYCGVCTFDADFREWGNPYWWQNTRLPYWTMPAAGDFDLMPPLFTMYMNSLPLRKAQTRHLYQHAGAFFPEIVEPWGSFDLSIYGDFTNPQSWASQYYHCGIELLAVMLTHFEHTQEVSFRDRTLLPMAREILAFYDLHWPRGADGKLVLYPVSALESGINFTNSMPEVAGLHSILPRLVNCATDPQEREAWKRLLNELPPIPIGGEGGQRRLLIAEKGARRSPHENPELYAVFPYPIYGVGKKDLDLALNAWPLRVDKLNTGWSQNGIHAAMLGLTTEAKQIVTSNFSRHAAGFRFPAMWGPNYDWIPDQDHGCATMIALQKMLLQTADLRILLLPAWPKEWDVHFKLHAPQQTTVECEVRDGKVVKLQVTPESRRKDVEVCEPFRITNHARLVLELPPG